jgi:hypothetical protein
MEHRGLGTQKNLLIIYDISKVFCPRLSRKTEGELKGDSALKQKGSLIAPSCFQGGGLCFAA